MLYGPYFDSFDPLPCEFSTIVLSVSLPLCEALFYIFCGILTRQGCMDSWNIPVQQKQGNQRYLKQARSAIATAIRLIWLSGPQSAVREKRGRGRVLSVATNRSGVESGGKRRLYPLSLSVQRKGGLYVAKSDRRRGSPGLLSLSLSRLLNGTVLTWTNHGGHGSPSPLPLRHRARPHLQLPRSETGTIRALGWC